MPIFDLDPEGRNGMWKFLQQIAEHTYVRVRWSSDGAQSQWTGKQPEDLSEDEKYTLTEKVQKVTEEIIGSVDNLAKQKDSEVLSI